MRNLKRITLALVIALTTLTSCEKESIKEYNGIEYTGDLYKIEYVWGRNFIYSSSKPLTRSTNDWTFSTNGKLVDTQYSYILVALEDLDNIQLTNIVNKCNNFNYQGHYFNITNYDTKEVKVSVMLELQLTSSITK